MLKKIKFLGIISILYLAYWGVIGWNQLGSVDKQPRISKLEKTPVQTMPDTLDFLTREASAIYRTMGLKDAGLNYPVFEQAYIGYINLKDQHRTAPGSPVLSIADLSLSSKIKRFWVLDLVRRKVLINTWVAHGQGSGGDVPTHFSNAPDSHQSSIGFYLTAEVYRGKHGRSLRLDGIDEAFNSLARDRAIVLHGADYVSAETIQGLNRLGRSFGCPAVPKALSNQIIDLVKDRTVLYIYGGQVEYHSAYLNRQNAGKSLMASLNQSDTIPAASVL